MTCGHVIDAVKLCDYPEVARSLQAITRQAVELVALAAVSFSPLDQKLCRFGRGIEAVERLRSPFPFPLRGPVR